MYGKKEKKFCMVVISLMGVVYSGI